MTLRPLWNPVTVLACALCGCAGAVPGQRSDPYAPHVGTPPSDAKQPPADVIGPGQRYPLSVAAPPVPKLTSAEELLAPNQPASDAEQTTATAPLDELFAPPAPIVPRDQGPLPPTEAELYRPSETVARVGDQIILYGDVAPLVDQTLAPYLAKAKTDFDRQEILDQRDVVIEQLIGQMIDTKLLYYEVLREVPRDKLDEAKKTMKEKVRASFDKGLEEARLEVAAAKKSELEQVLRKDPVLMRLALMMNQQNLETPAELDAALRRQGSSLDKQRAFFGEYHIGRSILPQKVNFKPEVTHQEMLDYYRTHADKFAVPAKARFEILTVYYKNFPTRQASERAIADMGNAVFYGTSFAKVAQERSQEPNADKGGKYDWTSKGSLASEEIDEAIFTLPPGKLSQILHDERGCHIVRVIERVEAGQVPFTDAQKKIKDAIMAHKREAQYKEYVEGLRKNTPVWTIYDEGNLARKRERGASVPR